MAKKKYDPTKDRTFLIGAEDNTDTTSPEEEMNNISSEENATDNEITNENDMEKQASQNEIKLSPDEVPDIKDMDIGNTIVLNVELKLKSKDEQTGEYVFDVTDVYSPEEETAGNENTGNAPAGASTPNLASMLGATA